MSLYKGIDTSNYPSLHAEVLDVDSAITVKSLHGLSCALLIKTYRRRGYPLGKSKKGLKKWLKKRL